MINYDILIHQAIKVLKVLYILIILCIIKATIKILFMIIIPQTTQSVRTNYDARGKVLTRDNTQQVKIPLLHR